MQRRPQRRQLRRAKAFPILLRLDFRPSLAAGGVGGDDLLAKRLSQKSVGLLLWQNTRVELTKRVQRTSRFIGQQRRCCQNRQHQDEWADSH
jgi:hypothetical protein